MAFGSAAAPILFSFITISHGFEYTDLGVGSIIGYYCVFVLIWQLQFVWYLARSFYLLRYLQQAIGDPQVDSLP